MDLHTLIVILAALCGITGIALTGYLLEHQEPIDVSLDEIGLLPDHTIIQFRAKIESVSFSKTGTKLELSDPTTRVIGHSDEFLELEIGQYVGFVASVESQNEKKQLRITRAIPND